MVAHAAGRLLCAYISVLVACANSQSGSGTAGTGSGAGGDDSGSYDGGAVNQTDDSGSYTMIDEDTSGSDTSGSYFMDADEDTSGSDTSGSYFMDADEDDTSESVTSASFDGLEEEDEEDDGSFLDDTSGSDTSASFDGLEEEDEEDDGSFLEGKSGSDKEDDGSFLDDTSGSDKEDDGSFLEDKSGSDKEDDGSFLGIFDGNSTDSNNTDGNYTGGSTCSATMYQHSRYGGWQAQFNDGEYPLAEFLAHGARDDDGSSIIVTGGDTCIATVYENGDFTGWSREFRLGSYDCCDSFPNDQPSSITVGTRELNPMEEENARMEQEYADCLDVMADAEGSCLAQAGAEVCTVDCIMNYENYLSQCFSIVQDYASNHVVDNYAFQEVIDQSAMQANFMSALLDGFYFGYEGMAESGMMGGQEFTDGHCRPAKPGCTDDSAENFDQFATYDDDGCEFTGCNPVCDSSNYEICAMDVPDDVIRDATTGIYRDATIAMSFSCVCDVGYMNQSLPMAADEFMQADLAGRLPANLDPNQLMTVNRCVDIDECHGNVCGGPGQECVNMDMQDMGAMYRCECAYGYDTIGEITTGTECRDINECFENITDCSPIGSTCTNTPGSFECACAPGFTDMGIALPGRLCEDENECLDNYGGCNPDTSVCQNTPSSSMCVCFRGFHMVNGTCVDIDECAGNPFGQPNATHGCIPPAQCTNTIGSYECTCGAGLLPQESREGRDIIFECFDIDECQYAFTNDCDQRSTECNNTIGGAPGYTCECRPGYNSSMESRFALRAADDTFDRRCADINECATGNGGCWSGNITEMFDDLGTFNNETGSTTTFMSSTCINYPGGSDCTDCPPGTVGDPLVLCLSVSLSAGIPDLARTQLTLQPVLVAGQANRFSLKLFDAIGAQVGPRSPVENLPVKLRLAFDGPAGTYTALATNDDGAIDSFVDMITLPNVTGTYTVTVSMSVFNQTTYNASADALIKSICWEDARWPANATEQSPQNVECGQQNRECWANTTAKNGTFEEFLECYSGSHVEDSHDLLWNPALDHSIFQLPISYTVVAGQASAMTSRPDAGQVCLSGAAAGVICTFSMDLKDAYGNVASEGSVVASLYGTSVATTGRRVHVATTRSGSSVNFQYVIFKPPGLYEIELLVSNQLSSRFTVQLVTGAAVVSAATILTGPVDLAYLAGSSVPISIYFQDQFGNTGANWGNGQAVVEITHVATDASLTSADGVSCAGASLTSAETVHAALDTARGTPAYVAQTAAINATGDYSVRVTVSGNDERGSYSLPLSASARFSIVAGPSDVTTSTFVLGAATNVAGLANSAIVTLSDEFGNRVGTFESVTALLRSPTDTWPYSSSSPIDFPTGAAAPLVVEACENSVAEITCPAGAAIQIVEANYGRTDSATCPHSSGEVGFLRNQNCVSSAATSIVVEQCDGQQSCSVFAANQVFGDPCVGTYKYLTASYRCLTSACGVYTFPFTETTVLGSNQEYGVIAKTGAAQTVGIKPLTVITASVDGPSTTITNEDIGVAADGHHQLVMTAGANSTVTIKTFDVFGNELTVGGNTVCVGLDDSFASSVADNRDGTYTITMSSPVAWYFTLQLGIFPATSDGSEVACGNYQLQDVVLDLVVQPAALSPANSLVFGPGVSGGRQGTDLDMAVIGMDAFGNLATNQAYMATHTGFNLTVALAASPESEDHDHVYGNVTYEFDQVQGEDFYRPEYSMFTAQVVGGDPVIFTGSYISQVHANPDSYIRGTLSVGFNDVFVGGGAGFPVSFYPPGLMVTPVAEASKISVSGAVVTSVSLTAGTAQKFSVMLFSTDGAQLSFGPTETDKIGNTSELLEFAVHERVAEDATVTVAGPPITRLVSTTNATDNTTTSSNVTEQTSITYANNVNGTFFDFVSHDLFASEFAYIGQGAFETTITVGKVPAAGLVLSVLFNGSLVGGRSFAIAASPGTTKVNLTAMTGSFSSFPAGTFPADIVLQSKDQFGNLQTGTTDNYRVTVQGAATGPLDCGPDGIAHSNGEVCCHASCGSCGGSGCGSRPGGSSACCLSRVSAAESCMVRGPPCVLVGGPQEWMVTPAGNGRYTIADPYTGAPPAHKEGTYTLTASLMTSSTEGTTVATAAATNTFTVTAAAATSAASVVTGAGSRDEPSVVTVVAGENFDAMDEAVAVTVKLGDGFGNTVLGDTNTLRLNWPTVPAGVTVTGTSAKWHSEHTDFALTGVLTKVGTYGLSFTFQASTDAGQMGGLTPVVQVIAAAYDPLRSLATLLSPSTIDASDAAGMTMTVTTMDAFSNPTTSGLEGMSVYLNHVEDLLDKRSETYLEEFNTSDIFIGMWPYPVLAYQFIDITPSRVVQPAGAHSLQFKTTGQPMAVGTYQARVHVPSTDGPMGFRQLFGSKTGLDVTPQRANTSFAAPFLLTATAMPAPVVTKAHFNGAGNHLMVHFNIGTNHGRTRDYKPTECHEVVLGVYRQDGVITTATNTTYEIVTNNATDNTNTTSYVTDTTYTSAPNMEALPNLGGIRSCRFVTDTILDLTMGKFTVGTPMITPGDVLSLHNILSKNEDSLEVNDTHSLITAPDNPPTPYVVIQAPSAVSSCDSANVNLGNSGGGAGRPMQFSYAVVSSTAPPDTVAELSAQLDHWVTMPVTSFELQHFVNLTNVTKYGGHTYDFTISARNWLNNTGTSTKSITKTDLQSPSVQVNGKATVDTMSSTAQQLTAGASFASCFTGSKQMSYQWTASITDGDDVVLGKTSTTRKLSIPAFTLQPASTYTISLFGSMTNDAALNNTADMTISTGISDIKAGLVGCSDTGTCASKYGRDDGYFSLDASPSADPDKYAQDPDQFTYQWTCHPVIGGTDRTDVACSDDPEFVSVMQFDASAIQIDPSQLIMVSGDNLVDTFEFSVRIVSSLYGRTRESTRSTIVTVQSPEAVVIGGVVFMRSTPVIELDRVRAMKSDQYPKADSSLPISFTCASEGINTTDPNTDAVYAWSISGPNVELIADTICEATQGCSTRAHVDHEDSLIQLPGGTLTTGATYDLTCTVTKMVQGIDLGSNEKTFTVLTNAPPESGVMMLYKNDEEGASTFYVPGTNATAAVVNNIAIVMSEWVDDEADIPNGITYAYGYLFGCVDVAAEGYGGAKVNVLNANTKSSYIEASLPPALLELDGQATNNAFTVFVTISDDFGAASVTSECITYGDLVLDKDSAADDADNMLGPDGPAGLAKDTGDTDGFMQALTSTAALLCAAANKGLVEGVDDMVCDGYLPSAAADESNIRRILTDFAVQSRRLQSNESLPVDTRLAILTDLAAVIDGDALASMNSIEQKLTSISIQTNIISQISPESRILVTAMLQTLFNAMGGTGELLSAGANSAALLVLNSIAEMTFTDVNATNYNASVYSVPFTSFSAVAQTALPALLQAEYATVSSTCGPTRSTNTEQFWSSAAARVCASAATATDRSFTAPAGERLEIPASSMGLIVGSPDFEGSLVIVNERTFVDDTSGASTFVGHSNDATDDIEVVTDAVYYSLATASGSPVVISPITEATMRVLITLQFDSHVNMANHSTDVAGCARVDSDGTVMIDADFNGGDHCRVASSDATSVTCECRSESTTGFYGSVIGVMHPQRCPAASENCNVCTATVGVDGAKCGWCGATGQCMEGSAAGAFWPMQCSNAGTDFDTNMWQVGDCLCLDDEYVAVNSTTSEGSCTACAAGRTNPFGDNPAPDEATACDELTCPQYGVGANLAAGCSCGTGYYGTVTATTTPPAYHVGDCQACAVNWRVNGDVTPNVCVPCPSGLANKQGDRLVDGNTSCEVAPVNVSFGAGYYFPSYNSSVQADATDTDDDGSDSSSWAFTDLVSASCILNFKTSVATLFDLDAGASAISWTQYEIPNGVYAVVMMQGVYLSQLEAPFRSSFGTANEALAPCGLVVDEVHHRGLVSEPYAGPVATEPMPANCAAPGFKTAQICSTAPNATGNTLITTCVAGETVECAVAEAGYQVTWDGAVAATGYQMPECNFVEMVNVLESREANEAFAGDNNFRICTSDRSLIMDDEQDIEIRHNGECAADYTDLMPPPAPPTSCAPEEMDNVKLCEVAWGYMSGTCTTCSTNNVMCPVTCYTDCVDRLVSDGCSTYLTDNLDDDFDGQPDTLDPFPLDPTEQLDTDGDRVGNNADLDDDGDGTADTADQLPLDSSETLDLDGDGIADPTDADVDGDGVANAADVFPRDGAETVDTDADGTGNNADQDDDNDGISDGLDAFPLDPTETFDSDGDGVGNNNDTAPYNENITRRMLSAVGEGCGPAAGGAACGCGGAPYCGTDGVCSAEIHSALMLPPNGNITLGSKYDCTDAAVTMEARPVRLRALFLGRGTVCPVDPASPNTAVFMKAMQWIVVNATATDPAGISFDDITDLACENAAEGGIAITAVIKKHQAL